MEHNILFVDDEVNVVKGIKRLFLRTDYKVFIETDCRKALEIIKENRISVLVSDMRMPEMNGVKFIKLADEIDPMVVKIILSGYSDIDDIMSAINEGHIYSYITKPWHDEGLKLLISNSCDYYEKKIREKELIAELKKKQKQLVDMNKNLEKIVEERTKEIAETNNILNLIIKGSDRETIYSSIAENIKQINRRGASVLVMENSNAQYYGDENITVDKPEDIKKSEQAFEYKDLVVFPITYSGELVGAFLLKNDMSLDISITEKTDIII